ncbi:MAG: hypothetical protein Q4F81_13255 [Eubacteriales bacterium]|nr:hypothetical protein [Eubacteriales bacterium]
MRSEKKWGIGFLVTAVILLLVLGGLTAAVDPYFHYHAPLEGLSYPDGNERYQNDGILRNFSYDAVITGNSMTENFLVSELNDLFGVNAVKVPLNGSKFREVDMQVRRAIQYNPDIRLVVRDVSGGMLYEDKDAMRTDITLPEYLYDENSFNDVQYLLNKEILLEATADTLRRTAQGLPSIDFDTYQFWDDTMDHGPGVVRERGLNFIDLPGREGDEEAVLQTVRENMEQNFVETARANPDIEFYCFIPPYSICWWEQLYEEDSVELYIRYCEAACEVLLECGNIRLFSFFDDYDVVKDLNNYSDWAHYSAQINSEILLDMKAGEHALTKENCSDYWRGVEAYYKNFDYMAYFAEIYADS